MKTTLLTLLLLAVAVGCTNGNTTINDVPVLHARVISAMDDGCDIKIITDKGTHADMELDSCYHTSGLQAGNQVVFEKWDCSSDGSNCVTFVYRGTYNDAPKDFIYRERAWAHKLGDE